MAELTNAGDVVLVERQGPAAFLTMNRPEERNSLSLEMMRTITEKLDGLSNDSDVRVIVLRGAGKAFSSGHNLREMRDKPVEFQTTIFTTCTTMMQKIQQIPQPVVAEVHGVAAAAGCQLVAACDLAIATDTALFLTPGVRIGLFCSTPMVALSRAVGRKRALEMLMLGEAIRADTAVEWGLINRAVPDEDLSSEVSKFVERLAKSSPLTMKIGKQAFYEQLELSQEEAYRAMSETMATNAVTCDAQEGIDAFLVKREPHWQGK